jgi:PAS domain S-box-containing protein
MPASPRPLLDIGKAVPAECHAALERVHARFALVEKAARIGYWRAELGSFRHAWSPGMYDLMQVKPDEAVSLGNWLLERIHPDDRPVIKAQIANAIASKGPFFYRCRSALTPAGAIRRFDTYGDVELNSDGSVVAILGVVQEVSDKIAADETLKASEEAYRFLADEASDIITRHGPSGTVVFVSPAVRRILGFEPETFIGQSPRERVHPDDHDAMIAALAHAKITGQPATYIFRAQHRQGHFIWLESTTRFIMDQVSGTIKGAISVTRDISERKRVEDELKRQRERAEAASQTKSRFLANMSHELRTPLNAIIGFSDIMQKELFGPLDERYAEYANLINDSGTMLLELINDLLDMAKIEAGKFELHYEELSAVELVNSCIKLVSRRAEEKHLEIIVEQRAGNFLFRADQRAMKQILLNMLSNAVKFTPKGRIVVAVDKDGSQLRICVSDTGIGIPADVLPRLGQPFEQVSTNASRAQSGSGLGLALIKSLTQLHGGELTIESQEGKGTEISVAMPLGPAEMAKAEAA